MFVLLFTLRIFLQDILNDRSDKKQVSHGRLVAFVDKHHDAGLCGVYKKDQLIQLCKAYGVDRLSRCNKKVLSRKLMNAVCSKPHVFNILPIDNRQYAVAEHISTEGHIRMRIRVTGTVKIMVKCHICTLDSDQLILKWILPQTICH
jgi:hypothetical protein